MGSEPHCDPRNSTIQAGFEQYPDLESSGGIQLIEDLNPRELLYRFIYVLFKRKWLLLSTFVLSATIIIIGLLFVTPLWKATARVLVRSNPQQQIILFNDLTTPGQQDQKVLDARNLIQITTSQAMAETIVKEFDLGKRKEPQDLRDYPKYWLDELKDFAKVVASKMGLMEYKPHNYFIDAVEDLIEDYQDVALEQDTQVINLSVWGSSPKLAGDVANRMAELLVEHTRSIVQTEATDAYEFTRDQVKLSEESLRRAEDLLLAFKESQGITSLEQERNLLLQRMDDLRAKSSVVLADQQEAEGKLNEVRQQLGRQDKRIVSSSMVAANSVVTQLKSSLNDLTAKVAALEVERTSSHPEVVELKAQIAELKKRLSQEPSTVLATEDTITNPVHQNLQQQQVDLQSSVSALKAKANTWSHEISTLQKRLESLANQEIELNRLVRDVATYEDRYKTLKKKLLELEVQRVARMSEFDVRVIDPAYVSEDADVQWPNWKVALPITLGVALAFALGLVLFIEYWNDTLETPKETQKALQLAVLGAVPVHKIPANGRDGLTKFLVRPAQVE